MKIVHKINNDSAGFDDQLSEEGKRNKWLFYLFSCFSIN
jgi:hypothetical protein